MVFAGVPAFLDKIFEMLQTALFSFILLTGAQAHVECQDKACIEYENLFSMVKECSAPSSA